MSRSDLDKRYLPRLVNGLTEKDVRRSAEEVIEVAKVAREESVSRSISARKRIDNLQMVNEIKDTILEPIFLKLGTREGVKMKDLFNLVIPVLLSIIKIQRCALFSLIEKGDQVVLEAGYPETEHGIGQVFSVKEPYIDAVVNPEFPRGDFENETVRYNYVLVKDPQCSELIPAPLKTFLEVRCIHSVLYVPLRVNGAVKYVLAFDCEDKHEAFSEEEIEILTFLGKELIKGLGMEKMGQILHDFRNSAIAAAAFARKVKETIQKGPFPSALEKMNRWLDIVVEETSRIEELSLTLYGEGKEEIIDLADRLRKRFLINTAVLEGFGREKVKLLQEVPELSLPVRCFPLHIDRVLDNLLGNATKAMPEEGGELSIRCFSEDGWAKVEIINSGLISREDQERLRQSDGRGRGLHITARLIKRMEGKFEVETCEDRTIFRLFLPLIKRL